MPCLFWRSQSMLSYRHAFHAGNFADVLKHLVQVEILRYLQQKDKPFVYIDTHAGAGLYSLRSPEAEKVGEYRHGIAKLLNQNWPQLADYVHSVQAVQSLEPDAMLYPGSPMLAQHWLRPQDRALLFELHPSDYRLLQQNMANRRQIQMQNSDGFAGLLSALPPKERRGLILIDPSYEIKTDYQTVVETLIKAHRRFATGTYALWYPVVDRARIDALEQTLIHSGIRDIQLFELGLSADTSARGMTSAGMIVINPPWTLKATMDQVLPPLMQCLAGGTGLWRSEVLVAE